MIFFIEYVEYLNTYFLCLFQHLDTLSFAIDITSGAVLGTRTANISLVTFPLCAVFLGVGKLHFKAQMPIQAAQPVLRVFGVTTFRLSITTAIIGDLRSTNCRRWANRWHCLGVQNASEGEKGKCGSSLHFLGLISHVLWDIE